MRACNPTNAAAFANTQLTCELALCFARLTNFFRGSADHRVNKLSSVASFILQPRGNRANANLKASAVSYAFRSEVIPPFSSYSFIRHQSEVDRSRGINLSLDAREYVEWFEYA